MSAPNQPTVAGRRAASPRQLSAALRRFQVIAIVVGIGLVLLVLVGVPLKYAAGNDSVVAVIGPLHGFLYIVYLLMSLDLALRARLPLVATVAVLLAGTVPFLSFVAERQVTRWVRRRYTL